MKETIELTVCVEVELVVQVEVDVERGHKGMKPVHHWRSGNLIDPGTEAVEASAIASKIEFDEADLKQAFETNVFTEIENNVDLLEEIELIQMPY